MKPTFIKLLPLVALTFLLGLSACGDDDPTPSGDLGNVELSIQGMVAGDNLALESATYDANSAEEGFRLSRLSFYLSDLRLVEVRDGVSFETPLSEVLYFNLGPSGIDSKGLVNIPAGDYTSLRYNFGLTAEQDMTSPDDYASTHPLGRTAEYWVQWESYIFAKIEGKADTLADGVARFEEPFVFHVGVAADNAKAGELAINFPVRAGDNDLSLEFDVSELMKLNKSNELPLTSFDHGNVFASQIVSSAITAFSVAE
ncbi:MAG: MbnP family protein [Saprospiraceae bacterium]